MTFHFLNRVLHWFFNVLWCLWCIWRRLLFLCVVFCVSDGTARRVHCRWPGWDLPAFYVELTHQGMTWTYDQNCFSAAGAFNLKFLEICEFVGPAVFFRSLSRWMPIRTTKSPNEFVPKALGCNRVSFHETEKFKKMLAERFFRKSKTGTGPFGQSDS